MRHIILHEWCCFLQNQSHCFKMERLEALIINKKIWKRQLERDHGRLLIQIWNAKLK